VIYLMEWLWLERTQPMMLKKNSRLSSGVSLLKFFQR